MTDTMTSQNIELSSWDTLYFNRQCLKQGKVRKYANVSHVHNTRFKIN